MPPAVTYQRERFADIWPEVKPLVDDHFAEIMHLGEHAPDLDLESYAQSDDAGRLAAFTLRSDGKLAGYACFWVGPIPQHRGKIGAWQDAVYVSPDIRGHGIDFLRFIDQSFTEAGINWIYHMVRIGRPFAPVLKRLGYVEIETVYAKQVNHG